MATKDLTETTFEETVQATPGIVLIDWWATWCGPCRAFGPIFEKVSNRHTDIVFAKIDTDKQQGLATGFRVRSIPTLSVFRDGVLVFHQPGMVPEAALEDLVKQVRGLDMAEVRNQIAAEAGKVASQSDARAE